MDLDVSPGFLMPRATHAYLRARANTHWGTQKLQNYTCTHSKRCDTTPFFSPPWYQGIRRDKRAFPFTIFLTINMDLFRDKRAIVLIRVKAPYAEFNIKGEITAEWSRWRVRRVRVRSNSCDRHSKSYKKHHSKPDGTKCMSEKLQNCK